MMTLEKLLADWDEAGQYGSAEDRLTRAALWKPYYSYVARQSCEQEAFRSQAAITATAFLRENGLLCAGDDVLDIGAGLGAYTLELAQVAGSVTALDCNEDCLDVLRQRAQRLDLHNISAIAQPWEAYRPQKRFDLSFSAMCPAICNRDELLRLEQMTRRTACLLTVTRGSSEKLRMELMRRLPISRPAGMVTEALYYYCTLYLMGRQPQVKTFQSHEVFSVDPAGLEEQYAVYLKIFGIAEDISRPVIRTLCEEKMENGILQDEVQLNTALIWWTVPNAE